MSTGGDPPISYASLAPFYDDYFLAYGSSFWNPEDMSLALAATLPPPPPRLSDGLSHDGRTRSTSVSSRKVAEQRLEDPTSITDMFAEKVMVRYRQEAYTVTIDAPAPADDPGKYTAFDVYVALGKKSSTMSLPSTRWGPMPTLYHPLVLPPHHYYTIFSKRFLAFGWHNLLRLWFGFTEVSDIALEAWTRQILVHGTFVGNSIGIKALTRAQLSPTFQENYLAVAQNKELVEMFIGNQAEENWTFEADPAAIDNNQYSAFLRDQVLYLVKDFEKSTIRNLHWDGAHCLRWYPTVTSKFRMPYPGETLASTLQIRARKLLALIVGRSPITREEIEIEYAKLKGSINPGIRFFLSKSLFIMAIRVVYIFGVKRIAVALTRDSTGFPTSQTGQKMFPVHILSFAGSILLTNLFRMAHSQEMHGEAVFEKRPFWHSSEVLLLSNCCDSLNILMAIPDMRARIEAILITLYDEFDPRFVLLANERQTAKSKDDGLDYTYAVPTLSTRYNTNPPAPQHLSIGGPVFRPPPPNVAAPPSAAASSSPSATPLSPTTGAGDQFPLVVSGSTAYESDSEDELSDDEGDGDEGHTAYRVAGY